MRKIYTILILAFVFLRCDTDGSRDSSAFSDYSQVGSLARFALYGDYLYVGDVTNLNGFSIINREEPVQVNTISIWFNIETLFNYKGFLYIGSRNGMFIYGIDNPEEPNYLSDVQHLQHAILLWQMTRMLLLHYAQILIVVPILMF